MQTYGTSLAFVPFLPHAEMESRWKPSWLGFLFFPFLMLTVSLSTFPINNITRHYVCDTPSQSHSYIFSHYNSFPSTSLTMLHLQSSSRREHLTLTTDLIADRVSTQQMKATSGLTYQTAITVSLTENDRINGVQHDTGVSMISFLHRHLLAAARERK